MIAVEKIRNEKGCEALASAIREQILSGAVQSGTMLPNERELVEKSGLSRGSVREAMCILETQGLISTSVGRNHGRRAVQPSPQVVRNSIDFFIRGRRVSFAALMETFETLAPDICALAAKNRTQADIDAIVGRRAIMKVSMSGKRFMIANIDWHSVMAQASHNALLIAIYHGLEPSLLDPHVAGFTSLEVRTRALYAIDRIQDAIVAGDVAAAQRRMESHVRAYRSMVEPLAPAVVDLKIAGATPDRANGCSPA